MGAARGLVEEAVDMFLEPTFGIAAGAGRTRTTEELRAATCKTKVKVKHVGKHEVAEVGPEHAKGEQGSPEKKDGPSKGEERLEEAQVEVLEQAKEETCRRHEEGPEPAKRIEPVKPIRPRTNGGRDGRRQ